MMSKIKKIISDVLVSSLLLLTFATGLFSSFDHRLQDLFYQQNTPISQDIIIIGIDEYTIAQLGMPYEWNRRTMADAVSILNNDPNYKPSVIALDILYLDEREDAEADRALVEAIRNGGNVVLAANVVTGFVPDPTNPNHTIRAAVGFEKPFEALREHAFYGSVNNVIFDPDNMVRRTSQWFTFNGEVMHSFPFEIYRRFVGDENISYTPEKMQNQYITYYGSTGLYKQLSFMDIFDEDFDTAFVADRVVMIGVYAPGFLNSYLTSAQNEPMYGVEIQANIVQMLLDENFRSYVSPGVDFAILLIIISLTMLLAYLLKLRVTLVVYTGIILIYFVCAQIAFNTGWSITLAYPFVAILVIFAYQLIYGYIMNAIYIAELKNKLLQNENEILQNRVSVMLSQIRPHFLFNSLVTIQELCLIDAQIASETVGEFSRYLRHNIDSLSDRNPVAFEKELMHVEAYLSIEKKRFDERLNVIYDISVRNFFIPSLTLQPLVENAVRHGVLTRWEGGTITISTKEIDGNIIIAVMDNGIGFDENDIGKNCTGIRNVRSRLEAISGGTLDIKSKIGEGTTSTIIIPIRGLD